MIDQFRSLMATNCYCAVTHDKNKDNKQYFDKYRAYIEKDDVGWSALKDSARRLNQLCYLWNLPHQNE